MAASASVAAGTAAASLPPEDVGAIAALLQARAAAVVAGDEQAYAATVADPTSAAGRRQLASYAAARALRATRLEVGPPVVETGPTTATTARDRDGHAALDTARAEVDVRYRVDDLDQGDRTARLAYTLVRSGTGWDVASETPVGPGAAHAVGRHAGPAGPPR